MDLPEFMSKVDDMAHESGLSLIMFVSDGERGTINAITSNANETENQLTGALMNLTEKVLENDCPASASLFYDIMVNTMSKFIEATSKSEKIQRLTCSYK